MSNTAQYSVETGIARDEDARNALIAEHLHLVQHVARQLSRSLATQVEFDELVSCGMTGLMNAIDNFDPTRGLAFSTFAVPRIRGSILDELRRQDHVPRSVRRKARALSRARESLTAEFGRQPTQFELAAKLGEWPETIWQWQAEQEFSSLVSLDATVMDGDGRIASDHSDGSSLEALTADSVDGADVLLNREQELECLKHAIAGLKEQERLVLTLYYFEELKLHEIADVMGVTESRASQIRTKALARLRESLAWLRAA